MSSVFSFHFSSRNWMCLSSLLPFVQCYNNNLGFPGGSNGKVFACNAGDLGWIPWVGRLPGRGNGYPFKYSCLENSMYKGSWQGSSPWVPRVGHDCVTNTHTVTFSDLYYAIIIFSDLYYKLSVIFNISVYALFCVSLFCFSRSFLSNEPQGLFIFLMIYFTLLQFSI